MNCDGTPEVKIVHDWRWIGGGYRCDTCGKLYLLSTADKYGGAIAFSCSMALIIGFGILIKIFA